ncbi:homoserine kinase [Sphingomonas swuensis]|uniref:Homoserine kinase n=1 Tax=Sphingomonas swuensis TaxID=977800 RepID=A0ABP7SZM8_9SPHN
MNAVRASAPASIGNVGVGFDIMGLSFDAVRDEVTAVREEQPGVRLGAVSGLVTALPAEIGANTALAAAQAVLDAAGVETGIRLDIHKGVPLSAGMGGSAASAVAGAAAANALIGSPFDEEALLPMALEGERAASDPPPWDNVIASLCGGLVLAASEQPLKLHRLPVPKGIVALLFHPALTIETRAARALLADRVPHRVAVEHSRRVAAFVAGVTLGDLSLLRAGFEDLLAEPQRRHLLPCLTDVQAAARDAGALGCSFSGSGPSVFALVEQHSAAAVETAMASAFAAAGIAADAYRAPLGGEGVRIITPDNRELR